MVLKVGVVGVGALGSIVVKALEDNGIPGLELTAVCDTRTIIHKAPNMLMPELVKSVDIVVECLPPSEVPALAKMVFNNRKILFLISTSSLLLYPEIEEMAKGSKGQIIVPSGAIAGLDAVSALKESGIDSSLIISTKPPKGFIGAPYITEQGIDLNAMTEKTLIFSGSAREAAKAFPKNVNVAATLSFLGIGPDNTKVEVWADPDTQTNSHEIRVTGGASSIIARVDNYPDPANPKSSQLAGYSIVSELRRRYATSFAIA